MPKNFTFDVIEKVKRALDESPRTINDIAERAETDWATTLRWLEILESLGFVQEKSEGSRRLFFARRFSSNSTLFDIPINSTDEKIINFIYAKTKLVWQRKTNAFPGKSHVQKVLARVNKELDLKLPVGWYLYGQVCLLPYNESFEYEISSISESEKIEQSIEKAIDDFIPLKLTKHLRKQHYEENHNELYLLKEQIVDCRYLPLTVENLEKLIRFHLEMIPLMPKSRDTIQFFTDFIGELMDIKKVLIANVNSSEFEKMTRIKKLLFDSFDAIWGLIAIESYKTSLFDTGKFTKELLEEKFRTQKAAQVDIAIAVVQELADESEIRKLYQINEVELTPEMKRLLKLKGSAKELSIEEKAKMKKRIEDPKEKSKILRELGFDD